MRLRLVVPADVDTPTGGNVYDLALADALRAAGDEVVVLRCTAEQLDEVLGAPWDGPTLVDGLLACAQPRAVETTSPAVLVHLPLALETGLPPDRAARLDRLEREALHAARRVVATSAWTARHLGRHHGLGEVAVARPGVEPAALSAGSDPPLLVQVAAWLPLKDQLGVVAALARLRDLRWHARLAGSPDRDPDYAAAVRAAIRAARLEDRVETPGVVARAAAWEGADLALLPSRVESFGMVVTEALARGVPVVVSEGGAAEALGTTGDGAVPGAVLPAGDTAALEPTLRRWLTDTDYRAALRCAALARRATLEPWEATARRVRNALT